MPRRVLLAGSRLKQKCSRWATRLRQASQNHHHHLAGSGTGAQCSLVQKLAPVAMSATAAGAVVAARVPIRRTVPRGAVSRGQRRAVAAGGSGCSGGRRELCEAQSRQCESGAQIVYLAGQHVVLRPRCDEPVMMGVGPRTCHRRGCTLPLALPIRQQSHHENVIRVDRERHTPRVLVCKQVSHSVLPPGRCHS
eukprot:m.61228 g.61228  ORF g.61228 m.61228 type:complete len:194 (+) comp17532_c0_seq1:47-628(+)